MSELFAFRSSSFILSHFFVLDSLVIYIVIATSVKSLVDDLKGRGSSVFPLGPYPWVSLIPLELFRSFR